MSVIFEAATLAVYKIEPARNYGAAETVRSIIKAARIKDPLIRADFVACEAKTSKGNDIHGMVYISLPIAVHEADDNAWRHVDYLRQHLVHVRKLECVWAPSNTNDRSRALAYTIRLHSTVDTAHDHVASDSTPGPGEVDYKKLFNDHPGLRTEELRAKITNAALAQWGIHGSFIQWKHESDDFRQPGEAKGRLTLNSPGEVDICVTKEASGKVTVDGSSFQVRFRRLGASINPTSCTTIGLVVSGDSFDEPEHRQQLQDHLIKYNTANKTSATITNVRMSQEHYGYLLCDPCDIVTAQGLCERPMPNKRYFRQVFFANANPNNYRPDHEKEYHRLAKETYGQWGRSSDQANAPRSGSLVPVLLDLEAHEPYRNPTQPSDLQTLRLERLDWVHRWHQDQMGKKEESPHRLLPVLHRLNADIATLTKRGSEHESRVGEPFQEDLDALTTQIQIQELIGCRDECYDWAKTRREIVGRIVKRIELRRRISACTYVFGPAQRRMASGLKGQGSTLTREEVIAQGKEQAQREREPLVAELAELIANDPTYEDKEPSTSPSPSSATELLVSASPVHVDSKRKYDQTLEAIPPAPPVFRTLGPPPSAAALQKIAGKIAQARLSLRALERIPEYPVLPYRETKRRELKDLERQLAQWTGTAGSSSFTGNPQPAPLITARTASTSGNGIGGSRLLASGTALGLTSSRQAGSTPSAGSSTLAPLAPAGINIPRSAEIKPIFAADIKPKIEPDTKPAIKGGNRRMADGPPVILVGQDIKPRPLAGAPGPVRRKADIKDELERINLKRIKEKEQ